MIDLYSEIDVLICLKIQNQIHHSHQLCAIYIYLIIFLGLYLATYPFVTKKPNVML